MWSRPINHSEKMFKYWAQLVHTFPAYLKDQKSKLMGQEATSQQKMVRRLAPLCCHFFGFVLLFFTIAVVCLVCLFVCFFIVVLLRLYVRILILTC
jgi:hypothetical protein